MTGKELKAKLKRGELVLGTMISELRTPQVGQLMANAGFDFMYIDMEHSPLNMETVADMILGARYAELRPSSALRGSIGVLCPGRWTAAPMGCLFPRRRRGNK